MQRRQTTLLLQKNEELIIAERRCKITLEDSRNVHVVTVQQLAMVEKQLEAALQFSIPSYV
jgi:hypothetical protein